MVNGELENVAVNTYSVLRRTTGITVGGDGVEQESCQLDTTNNIGVMLVDV